MKACAYLTALLLGGLLTGCTSQHDGGADSVAVQLVATSRNAGRIGQATLSARGGQTDLSAFISGVPFGTTLPLRLAAYIYPGTCAQPGANSAYELNRTLTTSRIGAVDGWRLSRSADVTLATLRATPHALILGTAQADGAVDIFCGDIK